MRNGTNIAGLSEFIHEVRKDPAEAPIVYAAEVSWAPGKGLLARTQPLQIGTIKAGRAFHYELGEGDDHRFTPDELALCGVGGCVLLSFLFGATARRLLVSYLSVRVTSHDATEDGTAMHYRIGLDMEGTDEQLTDTVAMVMRQSPNHRTVIEPCEVSIGLDDVRTSVAPSSSAGLPGGDVLCQWSYGCQVQLMRSADAKIPAEPLWLDQPKQMGGVDKGSNPQEFLFTGFAAQLTREFLRLAQDEGVRPDAVRIHVRGHVDIRGIFAVGPEYLVRVQNVQCTAKVTGSAPDEQYRRLLVQAMASSPIHRLIAEPHRVAVEIISWGKSVSRFESPAIG